MYRIYAHNDNKKRLITKFKNYKMAYFYLGDKMVQESDNWYWNTSCKALRRVYGKDKIYLFGETKLTIKKTKYTIDYAND
jgi:hypothetical protein